jgi:hypothetical protein
MKGYRFWLDVETTGLSGRHDQILELAVIVDDPSGNVVETLDLKLKLKHGTVPGPMAAVINQINPYSKVWAREAMTERTAMKKLAKLCKKYTTKDGVKPSLAAYNADFDKMMAAIGLTRNGFKFKDHFNRSAFDPLKTARQLVASGKLITRTVTYGNGRTSSSSSLVDIAAALGERVNGESHRAMADTDLMRRVAHKIFKMSTGYELDGLSADPTKYKVGDVLKIVTDSKSSGAKVRHILILDNDTQNERIVALDEDDISKNKKFTDSAVRKFNYGTIVGEMDARAVDPGAREALLALAQSKAEQIAKLTEQAQAQLLPDEAEEFQFDVETENFELIERVQQKVSASADKSDAYDIIMKDLTDRLGGDPLSAKAILTKAENLAKSKGLKSWGLSASIEGIRLLQTKIETSELRVGLHPKGAYAVGFFYDKNGKQVKELKECKTKRDLFSFIKNGVGKNPELEAFITELPDVDSFKDPKHPAAIEPELKQALDSLAVKPTTNDTKAAIAGIILQLRTLSPEAFAKYKLPIDPSEINAANYWEPGSNDEPDDEGSGDSGGGQDPLRDVVKKGTKPVAESLSAEPDETPSEHARPGDKISKKPCALCNRPLSAAISIQASIGPTCRKNLLAAETSDEPLDNFRDTYRPYSPNAAPRPGDLVALKFKEIGGRPDTEVLAEFISLSATETNVLDRRKVQKLLKTGVSPEFAVYLSLAKLPHSAISGIAKLIAPKVDEVTNEDIGGAGV